MMTASPLEAIIREIIAVEGPMPIDRYFGLVLTHPQYGYYSARQPFGETGDFVTAPEISQIFGELIGIWCASMFEAMGKPDRVNIVELGPGRGHLMSDILRAAKVMPEFQQAVSINFVESSRRLQSIQKQAVDSGAKPITWHDHVESVPKGPAIFIGNEFLDAIPIRQYERRDCRWHERFVALADGALTIGLAPQPSPQALIPAWAQTGVAGDIFELAPARQAIAQTMAQHISAHSGAILLVDYGHAESGLGDTLQAVRNHRSVSIFDQPGEADVTSHVDFEALGEALRKGGGRVWPVMTQATFLRAMGIEVRAKMLSQHANEEERARMDRAVHRLVADDQMGRLFKVIAATSPELAVPYPFGTS
jgi:NADH dehydrogenase [ubiquinone] 1 alpha subcomplex assembly factor 7